MRFVMVPGHGGSGQGHWQTLWEQQRAGRATRIAPSAWDDADEADWSAAITRAVDGETKSVLVAHSLGCLAAAAWLVGRRPGAVVGAFLVAPPDRAGDLFPPTVGFEAPATPLPVPAVVVASADDPYCTTAVAADLARGWAATLVQLGPLGHINAASGLRSWPQGRALLDVFVTGLDRSARLR